MAKDAINTILAIAGFMLGLGTTLVAILTWYGKSSQKRYAAERDFQAIQEQLKSHKFHLEYLPQMVGRFAEFEKILDHTKNSMKQMSTNSVTLADGIEHQLTELRLELKEIKSYVIGNSQRIDSILTRLDAQSGIWNRRDQG